MPTNNVRDVWPDAVYNAMNRDLAASNGMYESLMRHVAYMDRMSPPPLVPPICACCGQVIPQK